MQTKFDKIYVIHLASRKDRLENIKSQFSKVGLDYEIWWTTKRPFSTKIALSAFNDTIRDGYYDSIETHNKETYGSVFNCTFEHYTVIKQAYERGMENILICEDDINFIADPSIINIAFNNLPNDYTLIKYWGTYINYNCFDKTNLFIKFSSDLSTLCYTLSRKGMEQYMNSVENKFVAADTAFKGMPDEGKYITTIPIAKPVGFNSDII